MNIDNSDISTILSLEIVNGKVQCNVLPCNRCPVNKYKLKGWSVICSERLAILKDMAINQIIDEGLSR